MYGTRGNYHHCSRFDTYFFSTDPGQAFSFNIEDCLLNIMGVWRDDSGEFNVSQG